MVSGLKMMARRLLPFAALFLLAQFVIRLGLTLVAWNRLDGASEVVLPLLTGFWFDLAVLFMALPVILVFPVLLPQRFAGGVIDRSVALGFFGFLAVLMLFQACAEYFFWDEFTTRFNFIAVDYLIYTQEVLANILQSYPVKTLLAIVFAAGTAIAYAMRRSIVSGLVPHPALATRLSVFAVSVVIAFGAWSVTHKNMTDFMANETAKELGSNGPWNFVYAYFNNEIEFTKFYPTMKEEEAVALVQSHYANLTGNPDSPIERRINSGSPFIRKNVIQVTMESMNADFMAAFGNKEGLTPNLDRLAGEGIFLANMRATGTRTVRGLEALALSVPPTPGQSLLRRPGSENRFTLGGVFQDAGYETKFLYGGYGYFDNMNGFFRSNGYAIFDQADMPESEISFVNAWGVSDEDLFVQTIKQADKAAAEGKNFFYTVLTTSNHRPFTYPDGKIDIPSPGGRKGAVKYSDFSVGRLVALASQKPWFKDTVFVFVGDHTDSVAGKEELDFNKYRVPAVFWAPGFIKPQRIETAVSQIDLAPTLLGVLKASYLSRFFGKDILTGDPDVEVYVSNYEKVALLEEDLITVLEPPGVSREFRNGALSDPSKINRDMRAETIAWYQVASRWRNASARVPSEIK